MLKNVFYFTRFHPSSATAPAPSWLFRVFSGSEWKRAAMEEDGYTVVGKVAKASGGDFEQLYFGVDPLGQGIAQPAKAKGVGEAIVVAKKRLGHT